MDVRVTLVSLCLVLAIEAQDVTVCSSGVYCQGSLLDAVQRAKLYPDSKTFVDMSIKSQYDQAGVEDAFQTLSRDGVPSKDQLKVFVEEYFDEAGAELENWTPTDLVDKPAFLDKVKDKNLKTFGKSLCDLWKILGRKVKADVKNNPDRFSLLEVDNPFIVPGGRFRETYYWDTLWVVQGLLRCEMTSSVKGMLENFFSVIDSLGFVPNGFRLYYKMRSQPPVLTWMVDSYYQVTKDNATLRSALSWLEKEYDFWMTNRSVSIDKNGKTYTLNQYSTDSNTPRPESYVEDVETAEHVSGDEARMLYSNLASAAESGWDFSSRWFSREQAGNMALNTTVIKDIVPVDLNSFLCRNEKLLADFFNITGDAAKYRLYWEKFEERKKAIKEIHWNAGKGVWLDYYIPSGSHRDYFYPSNIFPMYADCFGDSDTDRANMAGKVVKYFQNQKVLDYKGGVPTSLEETGQQWDFPNAWPPLQEAVITAFARSSQSEALALKLAQAWVYTNWLGYKNTEHMFEKYDVNNVGRRGGGGEYGVQTGFGWTNGVVLELLSRYGDKLTTPDPTSSGHLATVSAVALVLVGLYHVII